MTLDEQIIACARTNGYKGDDKTSDGTKRLPHRKGNEWRIYFLDKNDEGALQPYVWIVTDKQLKQWQRNYKLKQLNI